MATTPVKVYGPPMSTAVSRVLACLLEKNVDFQLVSVNMAKGEHKKPDYLKIQPFGQVPAFQDESISLFESRAICRYICEKHAERGNRGLYGTNPLAKASIDQWIEAEGQSFNPPSSTLVFQLAFAPRMKIKQDPMAIRQSEDKLSKVLDLYDQRLAESAFLAGDEFSLADLSHLPNTQYLVTVGDRADLFASRVHSSFSLFVLPSNMTLELRPNTAIAAYLSSFSHPSPWEFSERFEFSQVVLSMEFDLTRFFLLNS